MADEIPIIGGLLGNAEIRQSLLRTRNMACFRRVRPAVNRYDTWLLA